MKKFKNRLFSKSVSAFTLLALLAVMIGPQFALAASVSSFSVLLTREKASTATDMTVTFTVPAAINSGETVILTFDNSTSIPGSFDYTDVDIKDDGADLTINGASPSGAAWGVVNTSSTVLTLTNGTTAVASSSVVEIQLGTNATFGTAGTHQITNGSAGTTTLTLSGTMGIPDITGTASMPIVDDDQVTVTATVNQTITFDLDTYATSTTTTETGTPYSVALGTLSTGSVTGSNESSINGIWFDLGTNAGGGAIVSIQSSGAALKSTSTPADTIPSATAAMAAGTANYGVCANRNAALVGTLTKVAPFASTCSTTPSSNSVGAVTTVAQTIYNTGSAPIGSGRGEIMVDAAISGATPAHSDYTDTLTLIATATF